MHPPERLCHLTIVPWNSSKIELHLKETYRQTHNSFDLHAELTTTATIKKNKKKIKEEEEEEEEEEIEMPKTVLKRLTFEMAHTL
jgi:hypothetical protein